MWRLRRATRCESGSVRGLANSEIHGQVDQDLATKLKDRIRTLTDAENRLRDSGTLSKQVYIEVLPLIEERMQSESENEPAETNFDREVLLAVLVERKKVLETYHWAVSETNERQSDALADHNALLPETDMDRVLRYEERMYRQLDWAMQRLLECQDRRRTVEPANTPLRAERSQ